MAKMISLRRISPTGVLLLFLLILGADADNLDICGGNGQLDSHALNIGQVPWNIAQTFSNNEQHYLDISPCTTFVNSSNYQNYFIPKECAESHICHNITIGSKTKSIGYKLEHVFKELETIMAVYTGPVCKNLSKPINYTVHIRYVCGNHLGHPSFPLFQMRTECSSILNWETSAACKNQNPTNSFGANEMKCYVIDDQNRIRDLSPLIRSNGSYEVMADGKEFFINVCTDISGKCQDSSACLRNERGNFEPVGSYKWSDIKFVGTNGQNNHEFIELTYRTSSAKCRSSPAVTKIRFICPKDFHGLNRRYPTLISSLECEYNIEWLTDFACPIPAVTSIADTCKFQQIDLKSKFKETEFEFNNLTIGGQNSSIILNVCGGVSRKCAASNSACFYNGKDAKPIGSLREAKFIKADDHLNLIFTSKLASCNEGGNLKYEHTVVEFECNQSATNTRPQFLDYTPEICQYKFRWQTNVVCPIFEKPLSKCSHIRRNEKGQLIQVDLSSLRLENTYYIAQKHSHNPLSMFVISMNQEIQFNVCDDLNSKNVSAECRFASVCLIDKSKKISFKLGDSFESLDYNEELDSYELVYSGGYDPIQHHTVSTKIRFYCQHYDNQPYIAGYDEHNRQYLIEFNTVAACPLNHVKGSDCKVQDKITGNLFDLSPLKSANFYPIRIDDFRYEFELNICGPIIGGSCAPGTAICQKELIGERRNFSLGTYNGDLVFWNSMLNLTFTNGDRYNDPDKTPRKSQISFVCDPSARKGHPEFIGETNRSYSFVWYTSLACIGPVPKMSHCEFENATHFIDLTPLSYEHGNHFALVDTDSIIGVNFCRSLNRIEGNQFANCKPNSAVCLVPIGDPSKAINLGEPGEPPFMSFLNDVHLTYNNGDRCSNNPSLTWTTDITLSCDKESDHDLTIMIVDHDSSHNCTYEIIVKSPIACPRKLEDAQLNKCVYVDKRTNLSANLSSLNRYHDHEIPAKKQGSKFFVNLCNPVDPAIGECANSSVCFRKPDQSLVSYGKIDKVKVYFDENMHLRFTEGTRCENTFTLRRRSTDIEFICDPQAHYSEPVLQSYDDCLAKFKWVTSTVCSLKIPTCSLFDNNGNYYSLRSLSSLSHSWKVQGQNPDVYYLLNVCKPLPSEHSCGSSSAACKCTSVDGCATSIGQVSDHEISFDPDSQHIFLTYEDENSNCMEDRSWRTQIEFQCSTETGLAGPKFVNVDDCTYYFVWKTQSACPHDFIKENKKTIGSQDLHWLAKLFTHENSVLEKRFQMGHIENYLYKFSLQPNHDASKPCSHAFICQTDDNGFFRDIGSMNNWNFTIDDISVHMTITSNTSRCGKNHAKYASSKIFFECESHIQSNLSFMYESDDCEYYFLWKTLEVCPYVEVASEHQTSKSSSSIWPWLLFVAMISCLAWGVYRYGSRANLRDIFRMVPLRRSAPSTTTDVNFRYQQLSL